MFRDVPIEVHAVSIGNEIKQELVTKYMAGAKEHGGKIWEIPTEKLVGAAIEEAIDQAVYLKTLQQQITHLKGLVKDLFSTIELNEEPLQPNQAELIRQIEVLLGL